MVRKSPAVVRYRSDLAISLNNLGMAYCKANKSRDADAAFGRARDLFDTLADDFPDEIAYRSSLAALLNNQALALAGVGRHADALQIYPKAIGAQRSCFERVPKSDMMRELLSKMYYNYGQSLRAEKRFDEATQAALARRQLWKASGERLLGVAAELAEIGNALPNPPADAKSKSLAKDLDVDILATLNEAYESGWPGTVDLSEPRFASLKRSEQFANKIAELNERAIGSAKDKLNKHEVSPTNNTPSPSAESSSHGRGPR
jgi:tetratricopeptide (TPR) repeat protein